MWKNYIWLEILIKLFCNIEIHHKWSYKKNIFPIYISGICQEVDVMSLIMSGLKISLSFLLLGSKRHLTLHLSY